MTSGETIYLKYRPIEDLDHGDDDVPGEENVDPKSNESVGEFENSESPSDKNGSRSQPNTGDIPTNVSVPIIPPDFEG